MTTSELIKRLQEVDPEGNRQVFTWLPGGGRSKILLPWNVDLFFGFRDKSRNNCVQIDVDEEE